MKKHFSLIICLLLLTSCYPTHDETKISKPDNLIEKDKIIIILADVEVAESALRQKQNLGHEIGEAREAYYYAIFTQHEVSSEQFDSSMAYYKQDLETLNEIYEEVITRLSVMESEIQHE
ncbi:MAG: DUF4296 domain-containing protein [Bacteroidales bacterium]|nr:DUF4296 domain-containing protein [Bacteroidales bacterium]